LSKFLLTLKSFKSTRHSISSISEKSYVLLGKMKGGNPFVEMTSTDTDAACVEDQQPQSLTREELQRAIQTYNDQRQVRFQTSPPPRKKS